MKKLLVTGMLVFLFMLFTGCSQSSTDPTRSLVEIARDNVINRWSTAEDDMGTERVIALPHCHQFAHFQ